MADFNDSTDPELGAACNRLAAWVEPLPEGEVIDTVSGLTERDLGVILRHLYRTRRDVEVETQSVGELSRQARVSVPITKD